MTPSQTEKAVIALANSPAFYDDGTCFAATQRGLLKTTDHGETWSPAFAFASESEQVSITAVAVSPEFPRDQFVLMAIPGGIGRSMDGGVTWSFTRLPPPSPLVTTLVLSPDFVLDQIVIIGTLQDGVFRSEDGGVTWTAWNSGLFDMSVQSLAISPLFADDGMVFVGTTTGVFRSTNKGRLWRPIDLSRDTGAILSLQAVCGDGQKLCTIWVGTESHGIRKSVDSGETWEGLDPLVTGHMIPIILSASAEEKGCIYILTEDALMRTMDGGVHWHTIQPLLQDLGDVTTLAITSVSPTATVLFAGTVAGSISRVDDPIANKIGN